MGATKRQDAKAATRAKVLDAAGVCFRTLGYERTTIRDIARMAEMSTGAVFCNWKGKDELYAEVMGHAPVSPELGRELLRLVRRAVDQPSGVIEFAAASALIAKAEGR